MPHPTPLGTRDILPDEMDELRAIEDRLGSLFGERGYREVATPTIEYLDVLEMGDRATAAAAFRFFDESGDLVALRTDMTLPIARMIADRCTDQEPPFKLRYAGNAYRSVRPDRRQLREFRQVGVELIGVDAPDGTVELIEMLVEGLDSIGLSRARIGLGDADLFRQLLTELGVEGEPRDRILDRLVAHDLVAIEAEAGDLAELSESERSAIIGLSNLRGGSSVLDRAREIGGEAVARASGRLAETYEALAERGIADRVQLDLGLLRQLEYYSGAILEVYDPALGHVLGGGGRYDRLMGRYGRELPAAGFALYLDRLHIAQTEAERIAREESR